MGQCLTKVNEVINGVNKVNVNEVNVNEVINKVKHDNIDQEYLDYSYYNVPFITKSKYLFKFW